MWFIYLFRGDIQLMKGVNLMVRFQVGGAVGLEQIYGHKFVCVFTCVPCSR